VVGSYSLINEVELATIYHDVFTKLNIKGYEVRVNSRKILTALAEVVGEDDKVVAITTAIDKLDKIGIERVKEELKAKELTDDQVELIESYLTMNHAATGSISNADKIKFLKEFFVDSVAGKKGIEELEFLISNISADVNIIIDVTLARGLNYYTGIIFEAKAPAEVKMGSIGGGGRYDDLTGLFDVPGIPGVGISFGVDRIYDVMTELNIFPEEIATGTKVLFFNMGETESRFAFGIMQQLRAQSISCELYHEFSKINKQFNYAEKKHIAYAAIIGSKEIEQKYCLVKDLKTGLQEVVVFDNLAAFFQNK
jgi:histidyl-tRNA synthetase